MPEAEYYHWSSINDGWVCPKCEREALPFHDVSNLSDCSIWSHGNRFLSMSEGTLPDPRNTTILSLNARSLLPKIDDLRGLCTYHCFAAIVVIETWLSTEVLDSEVDISGYI